MSHAPAGTLPSANAGFRFASGILAPSTWYQLAFHAAHLPIMIGAMAWFCLTIGAGIPLAISWVGLIVSAFLFSGAGWFSSITRRMSASLLGQVVVAPPARPRRQGRLGWVASHFLDAASWRAFAYLLVGFLTTVFTFTVSALLLITAVGALTHSIWGRFVPEQLGRDGEMHRGAQFLGVFVDTVPLQLAFAGLGLVLLVAVWPAVNHALGSLQRLIIRTMLGATPLDRRLVEVTAARESAVVDADATLRRIERELHDGTQARLIGLAMTLGDAQDRIRNGQENVEELVSLAHTSTKEALIELRALARGIHPPVLDLGLEAALRSACSRTPFPVALRVDLPSEPAPIVERVVYFGVLELLTNISQHAQANQVSIDVSMLQAELIVEVTDDGRGGAHVALSRDEGRGTGLAGLLERVRAIDGRLDIDSPVDGPTTIRLLMPARPLS